MLYFSSRASLIREAQCVGHCQQVETVVGLRFYVSRAYDDEFPRSALDQLGYHSKVHGKAFGRDYGVAVLS